MTLGTLVYTHISGRKIWINFDACQRFIGHINPWKKCSDLRPFSKYLAEPILRPLRSKDIRRWILWFDLEKKYSTKKNGWQPRKCKAAFCRSNRRIWIISCHNCHNITTLILEDKNWWETIHSFVTVLPKDGCFTFPMLAAIFFS